MSTEEINANINEIQANVEKLQKALTAERERLAQAEERDRKRNAEPGMEELIRKRAALNTLQKEIEALEATIPSIVAKKDFDYMEKELWYLIKKGGREFHAREDYGDSDCYRWANRNAEAQWRQLYKKYLEMAELHKFKVANFFPLFSESPFQ